MSNVYRVAMFVDAKKFAEAAVPASHPRLAIVQLMRAVHLQRQWPRGRTWSTIQVIVRPPRR